MVGSNKQLKITEEHMFTGVATALITPFNFSGVDYDAFENLIEQQISAKVDALLVCGTTGEPTTMSSEEWSNVVKFAIKVINKRVPVIVGTGCNCTDTAISRSIEAEKLGADMLLIVTPYYNKCTQNGLIAHYSAIASAVKTPIIVYNVPGRTGVNILPATCRKLADIPNIVAIKEASGNMAQIASLCNLLKDTNMKVYSGDDGIILPILAVGADGLISVASNAIPAPMVEMVHSFMDGDIVKSRDLYFKYHNFMDGLFCETNPIPIKYACSKLGLCKNILRLPLTPISEAGAITVDNLMYDLKLI